MAYTVEAKLLQDAAKTFLEYGTQLEGDVAGALPRCSIPSTSLPTPDLGFHAAYSNAFSAVDQGTRAAAGVYRAIGQALTRVSNHYLDQDAANAEAFGDRPIPAPEFPGSRDMSSGANAGDVSRYLGGQVPIIGGTLAGTAGMGMRIAILSETCLVSAAATMVPVLFVFGAGVVAMAVLKDPFPYFDAYGGWNTIEQHLTQAANSLQPIAQAVTDTGHWTGDGAEAFVNYTTGAFKDAMGFMSGLVSELKTTVMALGLTMAIADGLYLIAAAVTTYGLLTAAAVPEPGTRITIGSLFGVAFVAEVAALVAELLAIVVEVLVATSAIESSTRNLTATFGDSSASLSSNSMALTTENMTAIQTWEGDGWTVKADD